MTIVEHINVMQMYIFILSFSFITDDLIHIEQLVIFVPVTKFKEQLK